ncbi:MAG: carbohydrate binding family 9 domain-containing protein [Saprospiraceae bacterium]|nr:carbohydrate binding family 9 domain-containing protein [Saprospiraceae bacterium]
MKLVLPLLLLCASNTAFSQKKNAAFEYHIHRATAAINVDGNADDPAWQQAELATDFYQMLPMDTGRAEVRTEVRMLYDDQNLYLLAINFDLAKGDWMVESLRRDFNFGKNDNFIIALDPFDDQTNGFSFGANAMGAPWDGLMYEGGKVDLSWENKWQSAVQAADNQWVFEMAVPFKSLRYKQGIERWGINFSRNDLKSTEKSAWAPVPRQFPSVSLAYTGVLVWDEAPPPTGANISIIPYALGGVSKDFEKNKDASYRKEVGVDAKVSLTSSLSLDLTVNPDFSQVEVDVQQTNLDRFELFFPERRQFFLENADIFGNFGYSTIRPFFSRRIGLKAPIKYGARLSGKPNKNWRLGVMDMQTDEDGEGTPAQNFGVFSVQRRVSARSNVSAIFVNKQTFDYGSVTDTVAIREYNRNLGLEYNLASQNNLWTGKALYLKSFSPGLSGDDQILAGNLAYTAKQWNFNVQFENAGQNFRAETGYVPRTGIDKFVPTAGFNHLLSTGGRLFFPKSSWLLSHGPNVKVEYYFDEKMRQTENEPVLFYKFTLLNRTELTFWTAHNYLKLSAPFDPVNPSNPKDFLAAGTAHDWNSFGMDILSKPQRLFTWSVSTRYGGYFADGTRLRLGGDVGYRFQPYVALSLAGQFNRLEFKADNRLPEALKNNGYDIWLVGPRIDVTVTNRLFFTNFVQYNSQTDNVNLNLRLQWRYSPASDLFIVYTNNYFSDFSEVRNRALVVKLTYWWNI